MKNNFSFAYSEHINSNPVYFAINATTGEVYTSTDWNTFYSHTGLFCSKHMHLYCDGFFTKDSEKDIYEHPYCTNPFIFEGPNKVKFLTAKDITPYPVERDTEAEYFNSIAAWQERDRY